MEASNPFRGEESDEPKRRKWWDFFRDEVTEKKIDRSMQDARQALEWMAMPYHDKFLEWLSDQIDEPVDMSDQGRLVAGMARSNTFKEVRKHLRDLKRRAEIALGER